MRIGIRLLVVSLVALLVACPSTTPTPPPPPPSGPPPSSPPPPAFRPNPLNVQPTFASTGAVSASIGLDGGTLSLTDASGTQFMLTVAPGTLYAPINFTLTPLQTVSGTPGSASALGGVRLEPEDAVFADGATLKIVPKVSQASGLSRLGFKFYAQGTSFHLRPLEDNPAGSGLLDLNLAVWDGGTYGIVDLSAQDANALSEQHLPNHLLDAFSQVVAAQQTQSASLRATQANLTDPDTIFLAKAPYDGTLAVGFDTSIRDDLNSAQSKRSRIANAEARFKDWIGMLKKAKWSGGRVINHPTIKPLVEEGWAKLAYAYVKSIQRSVDSCQNERKPGQGYVANNWIKLAQAHVKGDTLPADVLKTMNDIITDLQAKAEKCFTFTLEFNSMFTDTGYKGGVIHIAVSAKGQLGFDPVQIQLDPGAFSIDATTQCGLFTDFNHTQGDIGTYKLQNFDVNDQVDMDETRLNNITSFELAYYPGTTNATANAKDTCSNISIPVNLGPYWYANFVVLHQNELGQQGFVVKTWDGPLGFGDGFAARTYDEQLSLSGVKITGTTTIKIKHTPQP